MGHETIRLSKGLGPEICVQLFAISVMDFHFHFCQVSSGERVTTESHDSASGHLKLKALSRPESKNSVDSLQLKSTYEM